jgi:hypothetical protein
MLACQALHGGNLLLSARRNSKSAPLADSQKFGNLKIMPVTELVNYGLDGRGAAIQQYAARIWNLLVSRKDCTNQYRHRRSEPTSDDWTFRTAIVGW